MNNRLSPGPVGRGAVTTAIAALTIASALTQTQVLAAADYSFTPVAFLGDPAPGGGVFANDFEPSRVNNRGEVAFTADIEDDEQEGEGIFLLQSDGTLRNIVRFGNPAPGGGTFASWEFDQIGLNDAGDLAFAFSLEPLQLAPFPFGGIFRYSRLTDTLTAIALPGSPAPGGGTLYGLSGSVGLNNEGTIVFQGWIISPIPEIEGPYLGALFSADKRNHLTAVATPADGFGWIGAPSINNQGDVAFAGWRADLATGQPWHDAIFLSKSPRNQFATLVKPIATSDQGDTVRKAFFPHINGAGDVAFQGVIEYGAEETNPWATDAVNGVFLYSRGVIRRVAAPGDALPGGGHIAFIPGNEWKGDINSHGEVIFAAVLDSGEEGLYRYSGGSVRLIAKSGTVIPGVGTIYSLEMAGFIPGFPPPLIGYPVQGTALNDRGQTAFGCTLTDGRVVLLLATPK